MPNRIIRQSICTSESMAALSWFEQVLFLKLIVSADDYGRYDARPAIIRGSLFPLNDVTAKAVKDGIHKLSTHGMIRLYEVDGKPYLELTAWLRYNTPRAGKSKYPAPVQEYSQPYKTDSNCKQTQTDANICKQIPADAPGIRIRNSVSDIRDSNSGNVCSEPDKAASGPPGNESSKDSAEKRGKNTFSQDSYAYKLAVYLADRIAARLPTAKPPNEKTLQQWADAFDKCNRLDGYAWNEIKYVLQFSQDDPFWQANILSGKNFRDKYMQLLSKMQQSTGKSRPGNTERQLDAEDKAAIARVLREYAAENGGQG